MRRRTGDLAATALRLDWRLTAADGRHHGHDLVLVVALLALLLLTLCESALTTGAALATAPRPVAAAVLVLVLWATSAAAAALVLVSGGQVTTNRIAALLRLSAVTRAQRFVVTQMLRLAGRSAAASLVAALPLLCLTVALLLPRRALVVVAASWLVVRLVPSAIGVVLAVAGHLTSRRLALLGVTAAAVALWVAIGAPAAVRQALPPQAVGRLVAIDGPPWDAWFTLGAWTLAIGLLEYLTLDLSPRLPGGAAAGGRLSPLPAWAGLAARICRVNAALLHGEVIRLVRWRRFGPAAATAATIALLAALEARQRPALPLTLIALLISPLMLGGFLGNLFAPDRAGVQAYWLTPPGPAHAVRAKIAAVSLMNVPPLLLVSAALLTTGDPARGPGYVYAASMAVGLMAWSTAGGRLASILFPSPADPSAFATGSLVRGAGAAVVVISNGSFVALAMGFALLYDTQRIGVVTLLAASSLMVAAAGTAAMVAARVCDRLLLVRGEGVVHALSLSTIVS